MRNLVTVGDPKVFSIDFAAKSVIHRRQTLYGYCRFHFGDLYLGGHDQFYLSCVLDELDYIVKKSERYMLEADAPTSLEALKALANEKPASTMDFFINMPGFHEYRYSLIYRRGDDLVFCWALGLGPEDEEHVFWDDYVGYPRGVLSAVVPFETFKKVVDDFKREYAALIDYYKDMDEDDLPRGDDFTSLNCMLSQKMGATNENTIKDTPVDMDRVEKIRKRDIKNVMTIGDPKVFSIDCAVKQVMYRRKVLYGFCRFNFGDIYLGGYDECCLDWVLSELDDIVNHSERYMLQADAPTTLEELKALAHQRPACAKDLFNNSPGLDMYRYALIFRRGDDLVICWYLSDHYCDREICPENIGYLCGTLSAVVPFETFKQVADEFKKEYAALIDYYKDVDESELIIDDGPTSLHSMLSQRVGVSGDGYPQ